ncbi:MAG: hypothetical protein JSV04_03745 [Candidatus Heimdallarchaeota archaeon]|nr:MAG: hypothetical protein JSV04_03745 [Candidatus Heimdallarchaeota archaeon]
MAYSRYDRYVAILEIIGAVIITGFWIGWFLDILKSFKPDDPLYETYMAFESTFPVPDAWIVVLLLISAYGIWKEKSYGSFFAAAAGGALVFLGLIDISFNIQQGIYQHDPLAILINLIATVGGGTLLVWFGRYHFIIKDDSSQA